MHGDIEKHMGIIYNEYLVIQSFSLWDLRKQSHGLYWYQYHRIQASDFGFDLVYNSQLNAKLISLRAHFY